MLWPLIEWESFNFRFMINEADELTLKTNIIGSAKTSGTLLDEQDLAIYALDKVLNFDAPGVDEYVNR